MTRLDWGVPGTAIYEHGVDRGVLYVRGGSGVVWPGLVSVEEPVVGGSYTPYYYDGVKYYDFIAAEDYAAQVEAYSAPPEFAAAEGVRQLSPGLYATQQRREKFGFSYRTLVGNEFTDRLAYKLHIVYNCTASPSPRSYSTQTNTPVMPTRTWTFNTVPPPATTYKPTAHFVIDSRELDPYTLEELENRLYGSALSDSTLPSPDEVFGILNNPITAFVEEFI